MPVTSSFDFSPEDDPKGEVDHYVVEWLEINVPVSRPKKEALTA
jgi:hypothetical protein